MGTILEKLSMDMIFGIAALAALFMFHKKFTKAGNKYGELLTKYPQETFKTLAAGSTLMEVINLSIIAMDQGRMGLFSALSRYSLIGGLEVFTTFLFITRFTTMLEEAAKDGKITPTEKFKILVFTTPFFIAGFMITNMIAFFYLESINVFELQQRGTLPLFSSYIEFNIDNFTDAALGIERGRMETTAMFMIYITPLLNIILVMIQWSNVKKKMVAGKGNPSPTPNPNPAPNPSKVDTKVVQAFVKYFGIGEAAFIKTIGTYCGVNLNDGTSDIQKGKTNPEVESGSITPMDCFKKVEDEFFSKMKAALGKVKGFDKACESVLSIEKKLKALDAKANLDSNDKITGRGLVSDITKDFTTAKNLLRDIETDLKRVDAELSFYNLTGAIDMSSLKTDFNKSKDVYGSLSLTDYSNKFR